MVQYTTTAGIVTQVGQFETRGVSNIKSPAFTIFCVATVLESLLTIGLFVVAIRELRRYMREREDDEDEEAQRG